MFAIDTQLSRLLCPRDAKKRKGLPKDLNFFEFSKVLADVAEPLVQCVPKQSLGTRSASWLISQPPQAIYDQRGPTCLVAGAQPFARVTVEVLVE